jgi:molecular chaperone GrpE
MSDRKDRPKEAEPESADSDSSASTEPRGLTGVDVQPIPPLDREQVEALRRENEQLRDQFLRKAAEFENYKKRVERDRQQAAVDAATAVLKGLVPTLDNLDRALEAAGGEAALREGVELIRRELLGFLETQGVQIQNPIGERFDPTRHQALSHEPAPGQPDGTIVEVFRKGYLYKDRLLRPALVKVAKGGSPVARRDKEAVH